MERQHDHGLEELGELEAIVAALGGLALDDAPVGLGDLERVVDLVGALKDVDHAHHRECLRSDAAVEGEVGELGLLHRLRSMSTCCTRGAHLGILVEDRR